MSVFKSQKGKRKWEKKTLNYLMVNARDRKSMHTNVKAYRDARDNILLKK